MSASQSSSYDGSQQRARRRSRRTRGLWPEATLITPLGAARGLDSTREQDRLYLATLRALADGLVIGKGRHGVVVALCNDPSDARFDLAVKIVSKVFTPSKGKDPSFHRAVSHTLHVQNEVAAGAKLSAASTFVLPLYAAMQDDGYVYIVMERACCSLKQLIQHADGFQQQQLLTFQETQPLKFLSFCALTTAALLHACWTFQRSRLIHHDIHPAQLLVTSDGRPRLADLGQCSVIPADGRKQLLPPLGRRDFCRPAKLSPLQGAEVDGYGCGATLWVTWKGCYDGANKISRDWNRHEERELLQQRLEHLASKAVESPLPRWPFAQRVQRDIIERSPRAFAAAVRDMIESLVTACQEDGPSPSAYSSFSADGPFAMALPFLRLSPLLAEEPDVSLEPTNFALPSIRPEEPWPPPPSHVLYPVYMHASATLRTHEHASASRRPGLHRSVRARPEMPELPIALSATPCVSMVIHQGRLRTAQQEPLVRLALVSMHVRDAMPPQLAITIRARTWSDEAEAEASPPGSAGVVVHTFSVQRDEFTQEGPSGPIEAKRILTLRTAPNQRTRITFEIEPEMHERLGFCATPPLLLEHVDAPADAANGTHTHATGYAGEPGVSELSAHGIRIS